MDKNNNYLAKDIGILLSVLVPLLFIFIGGSIWSNGGFNGTLMEELFPALFFGFATAFVTFIIVGNLFRDCQIIWWISGIALGITIVILWMCQAYNTSYVVMGVCGVAACILVLFRLLEKIK